MSNLILADHIRIDETKKELWIRFVKMLRKSYRLIGVHPTQQLDPGETFVDTDGKKKRTPKAIEHGETMELIFESAMNHFKSMNKEYFFQAWDRGLHKFTPGDFKVFAFPELKKCVEDGKNGVVLPPDPDQPQLESPADRANREAKEAYEAELKLPMEEQIEKHWAGLVDASANAERSKDALRRLIAAPQRLFSGMVDVAGFDQDQIAHAAKNAYLRQCERLCGTDSGRFQDLAQKSIDLILLGKRNMSGKMPLSFRVRCKMEIIKQFEIWKSKEK